MRQFFDIVFKTSLIQWENNIPKVLEKNTLYLLVKKLNDAEPWRIFYISKGEAFPFKISRIERLEKALGGQALVAFISATEKAKSEKIAIESLIMEYHKRTFTPLHKAAELGDLGEVKKLLELSKQPAVDLENQGSYGATPLQIAARCGHLEVVQYLVSKNADMYSEDDAGKSASQYFKIRYHFSLEVLCPDRPKHFLTEKSVTNFLTLYENTAKMFDEIHKLQEKVETTSQQNNFDTLQPSAEAGNIDAQYALAEMYRVGKGITQDSQKAFTWYFKAAKQGHREAQYYLAESYRSGQGGGQNFYEAIRWYRKAAKQKLAEACYSLGTCYETGQGVEKDNGQAIIWYQKAISKDQKFPFAEAKTALARFSNELQSLIEKATSDDTNAQLELGMMYEKGNNEIPQNIKEAVRWYKQAAHANNEQAKTQITKLKELQLLPPINEDFISRQENTDIKIETYTEDWADITITGVVSSRKFTKQDCSSHFELTFPSANNNSLQLLKNELKENTTVVSLILIGSSSKKMWIDDEGAEVIAKILKSNSILRSVTLRNHTIGDKGAEAIAKALEINCSLQALIIDNDNKSKVMISQYGAGLLAHALKKNKTLKSFQLSQHAIGDEGAAAFASMLLTNPVLENFHLGDKTIGDRGGRALANILYQNVTLKSFILANPEENKSNISSLTVEVFAAALIKNNTLESLAFHRHNLDNKCASILSKCLIQNIGLKELDLSYCNIGDNGVSEISHALTQNESLEKLLLTGNTTISDKSIFSLGQMLLKNNTLQMLSLYKINNISKKSLDTLETILNNNTSLSFMSLNPYNHYENPVSKKNPQYGEVYAARSTFNRIAKKLASNEDRKHRISLENFFKDLQRLAKLNFKQISKLGKSNFINQYYQCNEKIINQLNKLIFSSSKDNTNTWRINQYTQLSALLAQCSQNIVLFSESEALLQKAQQGDAVAAYKLGMKYEMGLDGFPKNDNQALKWYMQSSAQACAEGEYNLARAYELGMGLTRRNHNEAIKYYLNAAKKSHPLAQTRLGWLYENGKIGLEKNYREAGKYYLTAAMANCVVAQYRLALLYEHIKGVPKDILKAVPWYEKVINQGKGTLYYQAAQRDLAAAYYYLGNCYYNGQEVTQDDKEAATWYEKSAELNNAQAQNMLGNCYYYGRGVIQDDKEAVKWYEKAAAQNHSDAQCNLGNCYYFGRGVIHDDREAFKWYEKSVAQNNAVAQCNLGNCYSHGRGVIQDEKEAVKWYEKAAAQNIAEAQYALGNRYYAGRGIIQDRKEAVNWFEKAAAQNHAGAQNDLGNCYHHGHGVIKNEKKALECYQKAAQQGHALAKENLTTLEKLTTSNNIIKNENINSSLEVPESKKEEPIITSVISPIQPTKIEIDDKNKKPIIKPIRVVPETYVPTPVSTSLLQQNEATTESMQWQIETPDESVKRFQTEQQTFQTRLQESHAKQQLLVTELLSVKKQTQYNTQLVTKVSQLQTQLNHVAEQNRQMQLLLENKIAKQQAMEDFKDNPNQLQFYKVAIIRLENILLGAKIVDSNFFATISTGNLDTAATGVTLVGKLLSLIPAIGHSLDTVVSGVSKALSQLDNIRQTNLLINIGRLLNLGDMKKAVEQTVRQLTYDYEELFKELLTPEEEKQRAEKNKTTSKIGFITEMGRSVIEKGKKIILKEQMQSMTEMIADVVASKILGALLDSSIVTEQALPDQFIKAVKDAPSKLEKIKLSLLAVFKFNAVTTRSGYVLQLELIFSKQGIKTTEGFYFGGGETEPEIYGYRWGTQEEANALGLQVRERVSSQSDNATQAKQAIVNREVQKTPVMSYEIIQQNLSVASPVPSSTVDSKIIAELREQMAQQQAELKALKEQQAETKRKTKEAEEALKKLKSQQLNHDQFIDCGTLIGVKSHVATINNKEGGFFTAPSHVYKEIMQLREAVSQMSLTVAQHNEVLGISQTPSNDLPQEDDPERVELLKQGSSEFSLK